MKLEMENNQMKIKKRKEIKKKSLIGAFGFGPWVVVVSG